MVVACLKALFQHLTGQAEECGERMHENININKLLRN
jgi:hypothetical protein